MSLHKGILIPESGESATFMLYGVNIDFPPFSMTRICLIFPLPIHLTLSITAAPLAASSETQRALHPI